MSNRSQRTVLVTGSNSGIGLASAVACARAGFRVVGTVRSEAKGEAVQEAASGAGVTIRTLLLDVTDAARCAEVVDGVRPWGLVNNAGYGLTAAVEDVGDDEARALLETMVVAPVRLARLCLPSMRDAREGRIVNVSSVLGRVTSPLSGWYAAAKHALEAVTDALRVEVAGAGVRVVLVEPGGFRTNIWEDTQRDVASRPDSRFIGAYQRTLMGMRWSEPIMGSPGQAGRVVARALSARLPRARYLVGVDAVALTAAQQLTPTTIKDLVTRVGLGL